MVCRFRRALLALIRFAQCFFVLEFLYSRLIANLRLPHPLSNRTTLTEESEVTNIQKQDEATIGLVPWKCQKCHVEPPPQISQFEEFKNLFTIQSFDAVNWMTNFERTEIFIERTRKDDE